MHPVTHIGKEAGRLTISHCDMKAASLYGFLTENKIVAVLPKNWMSNGKNSGKAMLLRHILEISWSCANPVFIWRGPVILTYVPRTISHKARNLVYLVPMSFHTHISAYPITVANCQNWVRLVARDDSGQQFIT